MTHQKEVKWLLLHKGTPKAADQKMVAKLDTDKITYAFEVERPISIEAFAGQLVEDIAKNAYAWTVIKEILIEKSESESFNDFQKRKEEPPKPLFTFRAAAGQYQFNTENLQSQYERGFEADEVMLFGQAFEKAWKPILMQKKEELQEQD